MALLNVIVTLTLLCVTIETKEELNLDDVSAIVGEKFDYQIGDEAFQSTYKIYRIVQRGQRKLPSWLTFDTNSSMLIGYPKTEDVGMYTLRMRAQCIDPTVSKCQDKLSRTFHINVIEPLLSAESRGRKTFSKHGKKEKWRFTNMHNGNAGLYVEYDISRHGTVVENKSGMLDSGSEHVLSYGALYSAMQFDSVAKYFPNKNMHDKLSSKSYLAMQYTSASINILPMSDVHQQFSSIAANYPSNFINNAHIYNSDILFMPSRYSFSYMQYNSRIDRVQYSDRPLQQLMPYYYRSDNVHNSDELPLLKTEIFSSMQLSISPHRDLQVIVPSNKGAVIKPTFFSDLGFQSQVVTKTSEELLFTEHSAVASTRYDKEKSENIIDSDTTLNNIFLPKSNKNTESPEYGIPNICLGDQTVFYASLVLHVSDSLTSSQEVILKHKWANFISKDHNMIFIDKEESDVQGLRYNGKYILTAGPGNVIESLSKSLELSWHLACERFDQVEDFTQVMQHNIEVGRVSKEIGFGVIAWFVYTDRPLPKRVRRRAHSRYRRTATPTYSPPVPTTLSEILSTESDISLFSSSFSFSTEIVIPFISSSSSLASLPTSLFSVIPTSTQPDSFSSISFRSSVTSEIFEFSDSFTSLFTTNTKLSSSLLFVSKSFFVSSPTLSYSDFSSLSFSTTGISPSSTIAISPLTSFIPTTTKPSVVFSLTQNSSSNSVVVWPTPSLTSFSLSDPIFFSSKTTLLDISTSESFYIPPSQRYSTYFISNISFVSSSRIGSSYSAVTSSMSPLVSSGIQTFSIESRVSEQSMTSSKDIVFTTMSETSSFSSSQSELILSSGLPSSSSSYLLSSPVKITSIPFAITSSSPSISFIGTFESSMSLTSLLLSTSFVSTFSTVVANSSDFSSDFLSMESVSLPSSYLQTSTFQTSLMSTSSGYLALTSTSDFIIYSVTSWFYSQSTERTSLKSSQTLTPSFTPSSEYMTISAPSVVSSTLTSTDFISSSVNTLPIGTTTLTPSLSTASSLVSPYQSDIFSSTFSSVLSLETSTINNASNFLTSLELSSPMVSTTDILSVTISPLLTIDTISTSASSSDSLSVVTPSFPEDTSRFSATYLTTEALTTSFLITIPSTLSEASVMSTVVPATIISPTRVSETYSLTSLSSTRVVSTAAPDQSPKLVKSIDHLNVVVGRYFEYQIPEDTFSDKEDGNTRNLTLRLSLTYSKPFPKGSWLMFNESTQTFYGIPLQNDSEGGKRISEFTLIAKDSKGQVAKDAITLTYEYEKHVNHKISVMLNGSYEKFTDERNNLIQVARKLADFYEDEELNFLSFSSVEKGSVVIVWSNNSLIGTSCQKEEIQNLYDRLTDENETISDQFLALFSDYIPMNTSLEFFGACLLPISSIAPPTQSPIAETDNKMWIEIVLPALIAILVIVIIALLLLICCRHRRPSKEIKDSEKPAFLEDRRPIIFPDELEMVDPSLKPKTPLVLPSDYLTETPPAVPPHGRQAPPYRAAMLDDDMFSGEDDDQPPAPSYRGDSQNTEPPPYRLPPPYFNPHRMA